MKNLLASLLLVSASLLVTAQSRPNILWITCEDISPSIGCYGDTVAITPTIDKLAEEGVRFTNFCSISGVCAPSRSAIITGMYPTAIGTHNMRTNSFTPDNIFDYWAVPPPEVKCFPEYLRAAGYYCTNNPKTDYNFEHTFVTWDNSGSGAHWDRRPEGKPFFAVFNTNICHESRLWMNANNPLQVEPEDVRVPRYYPDTDTVRLDIARNYSNIYEMDQFVQARIQELEEAGLIDSTIIIWYSDHGGPLPRQKREINNGGLHVPMVIRFPNKEFAGTINEDLVSFIDLAPTMLSLAGIEVPEHMNGQVFLGENKDEPRDYVYAARDRLDKAYDISRSVRDTQFVYIKNYEPEKQWYMNIEYRYSIPTMLQLLDWHEAGKLDSIQELWFRQPKPEEELYDFINDPDEVLNLAGDPDYADKMAELRAAHEQWKLDYPDLGFTPEEDLLAEWWPNGQQQTTVQPVIEISEDSMMTITCDTEGASIGYQFRDITATTSGVSYEVYTGPVKLMHDLKVYSYAMRLGFKKSSRAEALFGELPEAINMTSGSELIVHPNPANSYLTVPTHQASLYKIMDLNGKVIAEKEIKEKTDPLHIDISSLSTGTYYLVLYNINEIMTSRFIKGN